MLNAQRVKYRKAKRGRMKGIATRGSTLAFRRLRPEGPGAGWVTKPTDRGRAGGAHPEPKRGGKGLDSVCSRTSR